MTACAARLSPGGFDWLRFRLSVFCWAGFEEAVRVTNVKKENRHEHWKTHVSVNSLSLLETCRGRSFQRLIPLTLCSWHNDYLLNWGGEGRRADVRCRLRRPDMDRRKLLCQQRNQSSMDPDRLSFPTERSLHHRFYRPQGEIDVFFSEVDECVKLIEWLSMNRHESNENKRRERKHSRNISC